ncbi:lipopolysaccharide biosynthesis protein [Paucilactobacillus hokkaidonensis]|nr:lipopolysaccharide biosynthesis protein [Paucilactobacillus hokkaidonensis]
MDFCKLVLKHIFTIIIFALVFGVLLGGYAKVKQSTTYSARRQMVISHNIEKVKAKDKNSVVLADMQMLNTYAKVADDQSVYNKTAKILAHKYHIKMSARSIAKSVEISPVPQTLIMNITASGKSGSKAVRIANATGVAVKDELPNLVDNTGNIKLLSSAVTSDLKSTTGPSAKKYAALGVAAGLFIGLIVVFGRYTIIDSKESKK